METKGVDVMPGDLIFPAAGGRGYPFLVVDNSDHARLFGWSLLSGFWWSEADGSFRDRMSSLSLAPDTRVCVELDSAVRDFYGLRVSLRKAVA